MQLASETNPLKKVKYKGRDDLFVAKGERQRRLHKALLRYHDPLNWPLIRDALTTMGKKYLIGNRPNCLVPEAGSEAEMTPAERRGSGRHGSKRFATKNPNQPDIRTDGKRPQGNRNGKPVGNGKPQPHGSRSNNTAKAGTNSNRGGSNNTSTNGNRNGKPAQPNSRPTNRNGKPGGQRPNGKPTRSRSGA